MARPAVFWCCCMTSEPAAAARVAQAFAGIAATSMAQLPLSNPALAVEAVGFRAWQGLNVGVLVTPWAINLLLLPAGNDAFRRLAPDQSQDWPFPSGVYGFWGGYLDELGHYQSCSLFSPPSEFAAQPDARAVAEQIMQALFAEAGLTPAAAVSRRAFLQGRYRQAE